MKVVSYKMFGSSEEFEKWQIEYPEIELLSIAPMVGGMGGEHDVDSDDAPVRYDFHTSINVFVTFLKEV